MKNLTELLEGIRAWESSAEKEKAPETGSPTEQDAATLPQLRELAAALKSQKAPDIDQILEELNQKPLDSKTKKALEKIADDVLMAEYDSALKTIQELADGFNPA